MCSQESVMKLNHFHLEANINVFSSGLLLFLFIYFFYLFFHVQNKSENTKELHGAAEVWPTFTKLQIIWINKTSYFFTRWL